MLNEKLKFLKDYFMGKRSNLPAYMYMPVKTIMWYAATPDLYFDQDDKTKTYTPEALVEIEKEFYVILISIVKSRDDIPISEETDRKLTALKERKNKCANPE